MKLVRQATPVADILNPRGQLAKKLEKSAKQASWLAVLCEYWLSYNHDNADRARHNEPTYDLPKALPNAGRFNKARKLCGAFEHRPAVAPRLSRRVLKSGEVKYLRGGKDVTDPESIPTVDPAPADVWDWGWVFDHWYDGGLGRSIDAMLDMLPDENRVKVETEMLK